MLRSSEQSSPGAVGIGADIIRTSDWTRDRGVGMVRDNRLWYKTMEVGGRPWGKIDRLMMSSEIVRGAKLAGDGNLKQR